jgi:glutamate 5-kinase
MRTTASVVRELVGAFGDNDELSSLLATAVKADWLLLLTNVDGFYMVPNGRKKPRLVRVVRKLTPALEAQCNGKSTLGRGGMISKLRAAKLASEARRPRGDCERTPSAGESRLAVERKIGTYFPPLKRRN